MPKTLELFVAVVILSVTVPLLVYMGFLVTRDIQARNSVKASWVVIADREAKADDAIDWLTSRHQSQKMVIEILGPPDREFQHDDPRFTHFIYALSEGEIIRGTNTLEICFNEGVLAEVGRKPH